MAEKQTTETESTTARQAARTGNGGRQDQNEAGQQSGSLARRESGGGRGGRALSRPGSRQLLAGSQHPFTMMRQLSREMDRLFDSFFGTSFGLSPLGSMDEEWGTMTGWSPRIDVQRRDDSLVVKADLPGVRKEDLQIDVDDNMLVIAGQRQEEQEEGGRGQGYQAYERTYGSFYRAIPLPQDVRAENVKAEMRDGVLKVIVPLPESAQRRRIQIQG